MLLTVRERLVILSILPKEGDFLTLKVLRKLQGDLSFTEEELKQYNFIEGEGVVTWDDKVEQTKEIPLSMKATEIIVKALTTLNNIGKLKMEHFDIYEKFMEKTN